MYSIPTILDNATQILTSITSLMGACAALAAALPKPVTEGFLAKIYKLINLLGCNFGNAENK